MRVAQETRIYIWGGLVLTKYTTYFVKLFMGKLPTLDILLSMNKVFLKLDELPYYKTNKAN